MGFFDRATKTVETMGKNVSKAAKDNMEIVNVHLLLNHAMKNLNQFMRNWEEDIITRMKT